MAIKFRNGEHHRNPSGFYNKVIYLLRESKRNPNKLYEIFIDISYHRYGIADRYFHTIKESWEDAYILAKWVIVNNIDNPKDYLNSIHYNRENRTWHKKLCDEIRSKLYERRI